MTIYDDMQETAADILDDFKQGTIVLTRITPGVVDPDSPWTPVVGSTTTHTLKATIRGVSKDQIDGTLILSSDEVVTASADVIAPIMGDTLTIDGNVRTIKMIKALPSAGTAVAYLIFIAG